MAEATVLVLGTCDTKLQELLFLKEQVQHGGVGAILMDVGRERIQHEGIDMSQAQLIKDYGDGKTTADLPRSEVIQLMAACSARATKELLRKGEIAGVISTGGSGGTSLAAQMLVSTVASGDTGPIVGECDITMMYSVTDVAGLNQVLRDILSNAGAAIAAMAKCFASRRLGHEGAADKPKKRVGITMFGVTTPGVEVIRKHLETRYGFECYVFHATGHGGTAMERLVRQGMLDAVLDLTTTEICDLHTGGVMAAGPDRLEAAVEAGIPTIVSVGAVDMTNFGPRNTVPDKYRGRNFYEHNPTVTLMRSSEEESKQVAQFIANKLKKAKRLEVVQVWLPLGGVSMISTPGGPFADEKADHALFSTIKEGLKQSGIIIVEDQRDINDQGFAKDIAEALAQLMGWDSVELGVAGRADHVSTQLEENFLCISKDTQEHYQIQENMSLCTGCQKLSITNIRDEAEGEGQEIYTHSVATFNCAIADNCYFCTRVQKEMPGEVRNQLYDTDCPGIRCSITKNGSTYGVDFCIPGRQLIAYFRLGDKFDFGFEKFSHTTDHETCWKRIAGWYKTCKTAHIRCHKSLQLPGVEKWLPTRLLDTEEANQGRVKVIPTADIEVSEREMTSYLVLSHCWGKRSFITLNQDNKARLQDSFSLDELPPNFRDAANATRRLGFRYVWIDSLCIIQGADGDWAEQAPLMDKVYMNAELCLAAAASSDAYGGFFRQREPEDIQPFKIDLLLSEPGSLENPTPRTFYAYCRGEVPILIWTAAVTSSPLNHRGWVQQERVLAPRTIHFSHQQACWECKELQAYEAGPDDAMEEFGSQTIKDWETRGPETVAFHQARDGLSPLPQDIYEAWRRVISQYSTCALSFERDTLVAASGMAKAFARHLGEDYAAGLWKGHLVQELLWSRAARGETRRHKEYRAPTWSWASVAGPVEWRPQGRNVQDIAKVRAVRVETCTADATGEVKYAELVLSGYLVAQSRAEGKNMFKAIDVDGEETAMSPDGCALAPLCTTVVGNMWKKTEGFLLTAAGGGANGTYRRLGLFVVTARTTDEWYDTKDTVEFTII